eukprot:COSAG04_NODE_32635_length_202_cov_2519.533981_1_plen_60_part_10
MKSLAKRVMGRLQLTSLSRAMARWCEYAKWSARSKDIVGRMLTRWTQKQIAEAFDGWHMW